MGRPDLPGDGAPLRCMASPRGSATARLAGLRHHQGAAHPPPHQESTDPGQRNQPERGPLCQRTGRHVSTGGRTSTSALDGTDASRQTPLRDPRPRRGGRGQAAGRRPQSRRPPRRADPQPAPSAPPLRRSRSERTLQAPRHVRHLGRPRHRDIVQRHSTGRRCSSRRSGVRKSRVQREHHDRRGGVRETQQRGVPLVRLPRRLLCVLDEPWPRLAVQTWGHCWSRHQGRRPLHRAPRVGQ